MSRQLTLINVPPPKRRGLFSTEFLENDLRTWPEWKDGQRELGKFRSAIAPLLEVAQQLSAGEESKLRSHFIDKVLDCLGWAGCYDPEATVSIPQARSVNKADYALFQSTEARDFAFKHKGGVPAYWQDTLAVMEAKAWNRSLDARPAKGQDPSNQFPHVQIHQYMLHSKDSHGAGRRWGILTNGKLWRLVHADSAHEQDMYYEADLEAVLNDRQDTAGLLRFLLFFRQPAFIRREDTGLSFLERVLRQTEETRVELEEHLKKFVGDALGSLMNGFVRHADNKIETGSDLAPVKEAALILLYRLLFVFNAEDRGILPVENPEYEKSISFKSKSADLRRKLDTGVLLGEDRHALWLWNEIKALFGRINEGYPPHGETRLLPAYNGGLFDPKGPHNADIERWAMPDKWLAEAVALLYWRKTKDGIRKVPYNDIRVQHLGNIYESMLRLQYAWKDGGIVRVEDDDAEQSKSGSYYTPDYIVRYIVERTLGPLCQAAAEGIEREHQETAAALKSARNKVDKDRLQARLNDLESEFDDRVLNLRVLDPAMGSGHFLVVAVDYLAQRIAAHPFAWDKDMPEGSKDLTFDFWKRKVVERCIYGVDKNPMAVELAKLSLWLHTIQRGEALSFLDHHLRCGNSLVGADWDGMGALPEIKKRKKEEGLPIQFPLAPPTHLTQRLALSLGDFDVIAATASHNRDEVHKKLDLHKDALERLKPWRRAADVWCSALFGNPVEKTVQWTDYIHSADKAEWKNQRQLVVADELAATHRFFHWWAEFPDAYFDRKGKPREDAGFDAVIGNPPYVRQEELGPEFKAWAAARFQVYAGTADLYAYFFERGHRLLRTGGLFGMITSNKFMRANYGAPLRKFLTEEARLAQIVDFGELPVFESAATFPAIFLSSRDAPGDIRFDYAPVKSLDFTLPNSGRTLADAVADCALHLDGRSLAGTNWTLAAPGEVAIMEKMKAAGVPLGQYVDDSIYRGVLTGLNEAFVIDAETRSRLIAEDKKSAKLIKPFAKGDDIRKYRIEKSNRFLIVIPTGWTDDHRGSAKDAWRWFQDNYPALASHLKPFKDKAEKRQDKGDYWWELRPCDYYDAFDKPKIVYPVIAKEQRFAYDKTQSLLNDKGFFFPHTDLYLLGVLNSALIWSYLKRVCSVLGDADKGGRLELRAVHMATLPIRVIDPKSKRDKAYHEKMVGWVEKMLELHRLLPETTGGQRETLVQQIADVDRQIDALVYYLYGLTEEEIAIVEGRA